MQGSEKHADTHTMIAERLMSFIRDDLRYSTFPKLAIGNGFIFLPAMYFKNNFCEYFLNFTENVLENTEWFRNCNNYSRYCARRIWRPSHSTD